MGKKRTELLTTRHRFSFFALPYSSARVLLAHNILYILISEEMEIFHVSSLGRPSCSARLLTCTLQLLFSVFLLRNANLGFERPSAIQQRAIKPIVSGRDVIAQYVSFHLPLSLLPLLSPFCLLHGLGIAFYTLLPVGFTFYLDDYTFTGTSQKGLDPR